MAKDGRKTFSDILPLNLRQKLSNFLVEFTKHRWNVISDNIRQLSTQLTQCIHVINCLCYILNLTENFTTFSTLAKCRNFICLIRSFNRFVYTGARSRRLTAACRTEKIQIYWTWYIRPLSFAIFTVFLYPKRTLLLTPSTTHSNLLQQIIEIL